jgi:hypothetical protein
LPGQTIVSVLVVSLDIRSSLVVKIIIDTKIYESAFDQFVARVLEFCQKIAESPCAFAAESPAANPTNQDQHQDDVAEGFDSDENVIMKMPVMYDNEDEALDMKRDKCTLWIN